MADFVDFALITVAAGDGGAGSRSMRREKYVPLGGPWGGDGGRGGHVIVEASRDRNTLIDFVHTRRFAAEPGAKGAFNHQNGRYGRDKVIQVPLGTLVIDVDSGERLADLTKDGQRYIAAEGGRGGRGNSHFKSSTRQAPTLAENGLPGQQRHLKLELKLLADVGLVGFPNAGKSTLLAALSAARPKIADYPFTTLIPQLGVVSAGPEQSFVLADLPGLVEGAHEGKGLGLRFLRHLERTRILLFLLDGGRDKAPLAAELKTLESELKAYHPGLAKLPRVVAISKADLPQAAAAYKKMAAALKKRKIACYLISAAARKGLDELKRGLFERVQGAEATVLETAAAKAPTHKTYKPAARFTVKATEDGFILDGAEVLKWVQLTDFGTDEAIRKLKFVFRKLGVDKALKEAGCEPGDTVIVGGVEFTYAP
jgi:GTP-binding protein